MEIIVSIYSCEDCRHRDHSGAFTTGGARAICGFGGPASKIRSSKREFKAEYPKYYDEMVREHWQHWKCHWYHRIVDEEINNKTVPEWCPLKSGYPY